MRQRVEDQVKKSQLGHVRMLEVKGEELIKDRQIVLLSVDRVNNSE